MSFSELEFLKDDLGLNWNGEQLCLYGKIKDYPVIISDDPKNRQYMITVFCKIRPDINQEYKNGITELLEKMPKNCVVSRSDSLKHTSVNFNAAFLYQENSVYLTQFVSDLCSLADKLQLVPTDPKETDFNKQYNSLCDTTGSIANETSANQNSNTNKSHQNNSKKAKKSVSNGFDKYSIRGLFGALLGGFAITVICSIITASDLSQTGNFVASLLAGALIAVFVLFDYLFLAKKIDMLGALSCCIITAFGCFFSAYFSTMRALYYAAKTLDVSITINMTMENWSYYQALFPDVSERFPLMLIENYFSAILACVAFFTVYYQKHKEIMYK